MISIARKNLFKEKTKFILSLGGVALSVLVILVPFSIYFGSVAPARALPEKSGANLWVVQNGSSDLFHTVSILPSSYTPELSEISGVNSVGSIINHASRVEINGEKVTAGIWAFDVDTMLGSPWSLYQGTAQLSPGEAVVDRSLAAAYNLGLGDSVIIGDEPFTIVGISLESNVLVFQYIFIRNDDAARIFNQSDNINYYLLDVVDENMEQVRQASEGIVPNSVVKTSQQIAASNVKVIADSFLPILFLLVLVGVSVGTVIIGLSIYSLTVSKTKEYGVLKAIGIRDKELYSIVFKQSVITSVSGFITGVGLYLLIQSVSFYLLPQVIFSLPVAVYGYTFLITLLMSFISSFVPIKKINSLDPAQVFKR